MVDSKIKCKKCDVLILKNTFSLSGGFCIPCFMKLNNGLKPSQLSSLKERDLFELFLKWDSFVKKGVPQIKRNRKTLDKLNRYLPLINTSISNYFRFGKGHFDGDRNSKYLIELKAESEGELLEFLREVEKFNIEITRLSKI